MSNSLIISLLLLCAVVILLVLGAEIFRTWRLRRDRVTVPVAEPRPKTRGPAVSHRLEPELDALAIPAASRIEPDLGPDRPNDSLSIPAAASAAPTVTEHTVTLVGGSDRPPVPQSPAPPLTPDPPEALANALRDPVALVPVPEPGAVDAAPVGPASSLPRHEATTQVSTPPEPISATTGPTPGDTEQGQEPEPEEDPASLAVLNSFTDCIVDLACSTPVPGERLVALAQSFRRCGTKPVTIEVSVPASGRTTGRVWRAPQASDVCRALRVGILLDNRSGPLNAMEFSEFLARTQEFADRIGAQYKAPILSEVLLAARRLDGDCAQLDCTASISVEVEEALGPSQLAALAGPLAIVERGNNRYARLSTDGEAIFSVFLGDRPNRLCFLLDLPRVHSPITAWQQMVECARVASRRLSGSLVDSGGRPLNDKLIEGSAANVRQRAFALEAAGLKPGSPLALRVFNG